MEIFFLVRSNIESKSGIDFHGWMNISLKWTVI